MAQSIRVALAGTDAISDSDPRNFALIADQDNILIKEHSRGSASVGNGSTQTVNHALGYTPHTFVYTEVSSGRYKLSNGYDVLQPWRTYVDNNDLKIQNQSGATRTTKYFIFYDNIG